MKTCLFFLLAAAAAAYGQGTQLICDATADPRQLRSEGITEPLGEIVMRCTGEPGGLVTGTLGLLISAPITNRLSGETVDAVLTAETSLGTRNVGGSPLLLSNNNLAFAGFSFNLPASGVTHLRITNILVDPNFRENPVTVLFNTAGFAGLGIRNNPVTAGIPLRGLLINGSATRIVCQGTLLPDDRDFSDFLNAGTRFATLRISEGSVAAFEPRRANATHGTRIRVRLAGFPQQARVFIPDRIAGSSAISPTSAGDLGLPPSGGVYQGNPGGGSLLLSRVQSADATGTGGFALAGFFAGLNVLGAISEVSLNGGAATIVYEVMDANSSQNEFAHIPLWIYVPANSGLDGVVAGADVSFAPVSTIGAASGAAPIPRFRFAVPPIDCPVARDCNASYFPQLFTDVPDLSATVPNRAGFYQKFMRIRNERGGLMFWTTKITYQDGDGWARLVPDSGVNNASMNLSFFPEKLTPGIYRAVLTIDAGPQAGVRSFPITLTVIQSTEPPGPPVDPNPQPANRPRFWTVGNAANLGVANLVPGSMARIQGIGLAGNDVRVTFDTLPARIIRAEEGELTVVVPIELTGRPTARLQIGVDSVSSETKEVPLAAAAPAIFPNAVYNQDGFPNAPSNPELITRVLQIFATGLPAPGQGTISARIHDRVITQPLYGGDAPGSPGAQQVNIGIPGDFPSMTTEVVVCGTPINTPTQPVCSLPATVTIRE